MNFAFLAAVIKYVGILVGSTGTIVAAWRKRQGREEPVRLILIVSIVAFVCSLGGAITEQIITHGRAQAEQAINEELRAQLDRNINKLERYEVELRIALPWTRKFWGEYYDRLDSLMMDRLKDVNDEYEGVRVAMVQVFTNHDTGVSRVYPVLAASRGSRHFPSVELSNAFDSLRRAELRLDIFSERPQNYSRFYTKFWWGDPITSTPMLSVADPDFSIRFFDHVFDDATIFTANETIVITLIAHHQAADARTAGRILSIKDLYGKPFFIGVYTDKTEVQAAVRIESAEVRMSGRIFWCEVSSEEPLAWYRNRMLPGNKVVLAETEDEADGSRCYTGDFPVATFASSP